MQIVIETTAIPVSGEYAYLGAAGYFAVLAYPQRSQWGKRDELLRALEGAFIRRRRHRGVRIPMKNHMLVREVNSKIRKAIDIICGHRLIAAEFASNKIMGGGGWGLAVNALLLHAKGIASGVSLESVTVPPSHVTAAVRAEASTRLVYSDDEDQLIYKRNRIMRDVWMQSLPVLHLSVSLRGALLSMNIDPDSFDVLSLIVNNDWLPEAVSQAERLRHFFQQDSGDGVLFKQKRVVRLLAK